MKNLLAVVLGLFAGTAAAAEIYVISAGAARGAVVPLIEPFQKESGHTIRFDYGTMGQIQGKLKEGQKPDVLIVTTTVLAEMEKSGAVVPGSSTPLGRTAIGVGVLESAPSPDISSVDAFRKTLLAARAVAYIDPAVGGTSGKHFAGILAKLGIEPQIKAKAVLVPGGYAAERVAKGEADLVVHQISEILPVKGVKLVGPLPAEIQNYTTYAAAVGKDAKQPEAATAMLKLLAGPSAEGVLKARGMERPPS